MRIADLAQLTGVPASTIRLWEKHRLIHAERDLNGYRSYRPEQVERVRIIRDLRQDQGLNIQAIRAMLAVEAGPAEPAERVGPWNLGARLRDLRKRKKLSLREVGRRTGLPISQLSTLERTSLGASVATLHALAACYGTTFNELTRIAAAGADAVVRGGQGRIIPTLGKGIVVEQLAEGQRLMDCQRWTLEPGACSDGAYAHAGEEFIHVLSGRLAVTLDGAALFELDAGDSIAFESSRLHSWRAPGPGRTLLLWVNCEPRPETRSK